MKKALFKERIGCVRKVKAGDMNIHKFVFVDDGGSIFFDSVNDSQIKGVHLIRPLKNSDIK